MTIDFEFLSSLGWNAHFGSQLDSDSQEKGVPGRVIASAKRSFQVQLAHDVVLRAEVTGRFAHEALSPSAFPAVGDWVMCEPMDANRGIIHRIFERKTILVRKAAGSELKEQTLAANVDTAFIVSSVNNDFNLRRIERYLTLIWTSGATPVVILTKTDLVDNPSSMIEDVRKLGPDLIVHAVSSRSGDGIEALKSLLVPGSTSVMLGSSGVGKSTLINKLFGEDVAKTGEVRDDDDKGRHTTTSRHLLRSASGALMIDTPGMRELQIWADGLGLETVFNDIEEMALRCKFSDCKHAKEPGCRIRAALELGELSADRLESYRKLQRETAAQRRKVDKVAAAAEKQKWKKRSNDQREHHNRKRRGEDF